ncbi:DNA binding protein [Senna tora]|uniref:DNA binding protein n=1 Tax=Senna tora TaxID=362788 RepID=A0A834TPL6_9FABA|nr:DNA binding protein [Senna tora]
MPSKGKPSTSLSKPRRMKQHLAGVKGQIMSCKKVPHDVCHQMLESLKNVQQKKQIEELNEAYDDQQEAKESPQPYKRVAFAQASGKKSNSTPKSYFAPRTTPGSQPTLKSVLSRKEAIYKAKMAIAKWFYDACIPFNAINSPYFQDAIDVVVAIGPGFK